MSSSVLYASLQPDSGRPQVQVPGVRVVSQSKWQVWIKKVNLLVPYMWPRSSALLQVLVFLCVCLLCLERLINVFVPIYSKNIGKKLRGTACCQTSSTFTNWCKAAQKIVQLLLGRTEANAQFITWNEMWMHQDTHLKQKVKEKKFTRDPLTLCFLWLFIFLYLTLVLF